MKKKLNYQVSQNKIAFNTGRHTLMLDICNAQFSQVVELLNQHAPSQISLHCDMPDKMYLLLLRAIYHCRIENMFIRLLIIPCGEPVENYLFPIAKMFGQEITACVRKVFSKALVVTFQVQRKVPSYNRQIGFYIISDGKNPARLRAVLQSVFAQDIPNKLVTVVGPLHLQQTDMMKEFPDCVILSDADIYSATDQRFPIARKKNLALTQQDDCARVVILHDRITLSPTWAQQLLQQNPYFDLYTCKISAGSYRYLDKFGLKFKGYLTLNKRHFYLTYAEDNAEQFVDGGFFVLHRRALQNLQFDSHLHWGEMEDVDFVLRLKLQGNLITFAADNTVQSEFAGHFALKERSVCTSIYKIFLRRWGFSRYLITLARYLRFFLQKNSNAMKH